VAGDMAHGRCRTMLEWGYYKKDQDQYGVPDLWKPIDFEKDAAQWGDCEDYALGFMIWCAKEGVPPGSMRMLIGYKRRLRANLTAPIRWEGHAIVWIATTEGNWISDIEAPALFRAGRIFNRPWLGSAYRLFRPAAEVIKETT